MSLACFRGSHRARRPGAIAFCVTESARMRPNAATRPLLPIVPQRSRFFRPKSRSKFSSLPDGVDHQCEDIRIWRAGEDMRRRLAAALQSAKRVVFGASRLGQVPGRWAPEGTGRADKKRNDLLPMCIGEYRNQGKRDREGSRESSASRLLSTERL